MATSRVTLPHAHWTVELGRVIWAPGAADYILLGSPLAQFPTETLLLGRLEIPRDSAQDLGIELSRNFEPSLDTGPNFSNRMRNSGTLTFVASNGDSLVVQGISDDFEPYYWRPSNIAAVYTFGDILAGLTDRSLVATFTDNVAEAPRFIDPNWRCHPLDYRGGYHADNRSGGHRDAATDLYGRGHATSWHHLQRRDTDLLRDTYGDVGRGRPDCPGHKQRGNGGLAYQLRRQRCVGGGKQLLARGPSRFCGLPRGCSTEGLSWSHPDTRHGASRARPMVVLQWEGYRLRRRVHGGKRDF